MMDTKKRADEMLRTMTGTPRQQLRSILEAADVRAKIETVQAHQLTDAGWRGGPKSAEATVLASTLSPEAYEFLRALSLLTSRIRLDFAGFGAPATHTYTIRVR